MRVESLFIPILMIIFSQIHFKNFRRAFVECLLYAYLLKATAIFNFKAWNLKIHFRYKLSVLPLK